MSDTTPPEPPQLLSLRSDIILTAVNFLKDPQVKSAPLSKRLAFLEGKGLTPEEIDLALIKANDKDKDGVATNCLNQNQSQNSKPKTMSQTNDQAQRSSSYKGLILTTAVILGTGSLIISNYQTIKSFAKKLLRPDDDEIKRVESELRQSIQELKDMIEEKERLLQEALKVQSSKASESE